MHHSGATRKAGKGLDGGCNSLGRFLGGGALLVDEIRLDGNELIVRGNHAG